MNVLYHLIQFGIPCDAWHVWRSYGFGNLPNSPYGNPRGHHRSFPLKQVLLHPCAKLPNQVLISGCRNVTHQWHQCITVVLPNDIKSFQYVAVHHVAAITVLFSAGSGTVSVFDQFLFSKSSCISRNVIQLEVIVSTPSLSLTVSWVKETSESNPGPQNPQLSCPRYPSSIIHHDVWLLHPEIKIWFGSFAQGCRRTCFNGKLRWCPLVAIQSEQPDF